jgi:predicted amidophosphoribosyltransferase
MRDLIAPVSCVSCGRRGSAACRSCARELHAPHACGSVEGVERLVAAFVYEGLARRLVLGLKLRGLQACADPLVDGMVAAARRDGLSGAVVTWVPGRRRDVLDRGFDHAGLLASGVADNLGLRAVSLLRHSGRRRDQAGLTAAERWINLSHAFRSLAVTGPVVLVDDLVTTGATAHWAARALREAGARGVEALVACRA